MHTRNIAGRPVPGVGLGTAGLALAGPDRTGSIATIHTALDGGVRLLDTAAAYVPDVASPGFGERLVAEAVATWDGPLDEVLVVTKGGHRRVADGFEPGSFEVCGRADFIRMQAEQSLEALGTTAIDLYLLHWPDPAVPITESMRALEALRTDGLVRAVGLSNVTVEQLDEARTAGRIDAVQNRYSPTYRAEEPVLEWCASNGVPFLAYSPLGGLGRAHELGTRLPAIAEVARARRASPHQVALAWLLSHSPVVVPIPGCRRVDSARDCAGALGLELTAEEQRRIDGEGAT